MPVAPRLPVEPFAPVDPLGPRGLAIGRTGTLPAGPHSVIIAAATSVPVSFSGAGLSVIAATG